MLRAPDKKKSTPIVVFERKNKKIFAMRVSHGFKEYLNEQQKLEYRFRNCRAKLASKRSKLVLKTRGKSAVEGTL